MIDLAISIVLYHTDDIELENVINLINKSNLSKQIYLIDNSLDKYLEKFAIYPNVEYIFNGANIGYGSAHNIAIRKAEMIGAKYHLILNADVDFDPEILFKAFEFMEINSEVVMISPQILSPDGELQYFSRKLPSPFDLFARRFIPSFLHPLVKRKMDQYLLLHRDYMKPMINVPNFPGCFMFVRSSILSEINGFDENFFMYVEDIDLTRRLLQRGTTLYYPEIKIKHRLARGSAKFSKLMAFHIKSTVYYFNKWGWFNDRDRKSINNVL